MDLVTGASGLLGNNLTRLLASQGRRVRVLLRAPEKAVYVRNVPGVEHVIGDILQKESLSAAFEGIERVYHCAAQVSMWPFAAEAIYATNVQGTRNMLTAARRHGVRRFVFCSSVDAIGLPPKGEVSDETTPWNWARLGLDNPYARSKYLAQQAVLQAASEGLEAVVVNPAYMFGACDIKPSSGKMILAVARGTVRGYPSGGNNFVDVMDVARGAVAAAERGRRGEMYILGNENLSYREIFTLIAEEAGVTPPRIPIPYALAVLGGYAGTLWGRLTGREPSIHTVLARMGYVQHYYSSRKAVTELGMPQTPVREAVRRALGWFKEQKML